MMSRSPVSPEMPELAQGIDILEESVRTMDRQLLRILLSDRTTGKNILWATEDYASYGPKFGAHCAITPGLVTGKYAALIQPRITKSQSARLGRTRDKAEVFTPAWICNKQNNLIDAAWFGVENTFNLEQDQDWLATSGKIPFPTPSGRTWEDYVLDARLEIACGEAPYLASRYDAVTGKSIELSCRIGFLDRKMRVVAENVETDEDWRKWTKIAFQNIYGYDWQGDNVLLARENLLLSYVDYYRARFGGRDPEKKELREIARILSWNIWQMDGLKFVVPNSCQEIVDGQIHMLGDKGKRRPCEGCAKNDPLLHNGIYCNIKDWKANKTVEFVSLLKSGVRR